MGDPLTVRMLLTEVYWRHWLNRVFSFSISRPNDSHGFDKIYITWYLTRSYSCSFILQNMCEGAININPAQNITLLTYFFGREKNNFLSRNVDRPWPFIWVLRAKNFCQRQSEVCNPRIDAIAIDLIIMFCINPKIMCQVYISGKVSYPPNCNKYSSSDPAMNFILRKYSHFRKSTININHISQ